MRFDDLDHGNHRKAAEAMRAIIVHSAIHHLGEAPFQSIDPFSAAILENRGLLAAKQDDSSIDSVVSILNSIDTSVRLAADAGPYIFFRGADRASMFDPSELLADPACNRRLAAVKYFEELPPNFLAGRTRREIETARPRIASDNKAEWFPAAKAVYDSLRTDVYLALAGFSQCYNLGFVQGVNNFLTQLLRPDTRLLSSIDIEHFNPSEEYEAIQAVVRRLAASATLTEAIAEYFRQFGHLPLCGSVGFGEVLRGWAENNDGGKCWETVWAWADECQSPMARYHACVAFLVNPDLVPSGVEQFLWGELGDVVNLYSEDSTRTRWVEAWAIRNELAQHLANYLECLLPGMPGERLMVMAWWLTERICERLPPSPGLLTQFRNTTLAGELQRSRFMNELTHPPIGLSSLRYMTRMMPRVWSASALCELGGAQWLFDRVVPSHDVGDGIDRSLTSLLILGYPRPVNAGIRAVYAFEGSLGPTATAWAKVTADHQAAVEQTELAAALRIADEASSSRALPALVDDLATVKSGKDLRAADFIRQLAHFNPTIGEPLWDLFCENKRYLEIFRNASSESLVLLFEALTELQVQQGAKWRLNLAHFYALAATEAKDPVRQELLFRFTVFASIHAGSVSAVDRLMHGHHRSEFAKLVGEWHHQLAHSTHLFTPWATARIRALLPSLTLDELVRSL